MNYVLLLDFFFNFEFSPLFVVGRDEYILYG
jgi:hypothetical protein